MNTVEFDLKVLKLYDHKVCDDCAPIKSIQPLSNLLLTVLRAVFLLYVVTQYFCHCRLFLYYLEQPRSNNQGKSLWRPVLVYTHLIDI